MLLLQMSSRNLADDMMPRSEQASAQVTLGVTYTDVAVESVSENSSRMAPKIWMPLLLAACIR